MRSLRKQNLIIFIIVLWPVFFANAQKFKKDLLKERGYLIFYEMDAIFIPSTEITDSLFINKYKGDTGYKVGEHEYTLRLKEISKEYEVVTNYLLNDSLVSEKKIISLIPVEIKFRRTSSILSWQNTALLFRYQNTDYIFNYCTYSKRIIISIVPVRSKDIIRYKQKIQAMPE
jgi:hypothetical protein